MCDRDRMIGMLEKGNFSIAAAKAIGQSEGSIQGFIADLIQDYLRKKDDVGNRIFIHRDDVYNYLSVQIKDLSRNTFDTILIKLIPKYVEEKGETLRLLMERPRNMPL